MVLSPKTRSGFFTFATLAAGLLLLEVFYLAKNWGFHFDEANYLLMARHTWLGDAAEVGKPFLIFALNRLGYLTIEAVGLRNFYPFVWHLGLSFVFVLSLWYWISSLREKKSFSLLIYFQLLCQPITLLTVTAPMMELPLLVILNLFFGALNRRERARSAELGAAAAATLLKMTALPVFLAMAAARFFEKRHLRSVLFLVLGIALGFGIHKFSLMWLGAASYPFYNLKQGLAPGKWVYWVGVSAFVLGPFSLSLLFLFVKKSRSLLSRPELFLFGAAIGIVQITQHNFIRYLFPLLWALNLLLLTEFRRIPAARIVLALSLVVSLGQSLAFYHPVLRDQIWPRMIVHEAFYSPGTTLPGVRPWDLWRLNQANPSNERILLGEQAAEHAFTVPLLDTFVPRVPAVKNKVDLEGPFAAAFFAGPRREDFRCQNDMDPCPIEMHLRDCLELPNYWQERAADVLVFKNCLKSQNLAK